MGVDLSVVGSDLYMLGWENKLKHKLALLKIEYKLYKRYVDDCGVALYAFNKGWYFDKQQNKMAFSRGGEGG